MLLHSLQPTRIVVLSCGVKQETSYNAWGLADGAAPSACGLVMWDPGLVELNTPAKFYVSTASSGTG